MYLAGKNCGKGSFMSVECACELVGAVPIARADSRQANAEGSLGVRKCLLSIIHADLHAQNKQPLGIGSHVNEHIPFATISNAKTDAHDLFSSTTSRRCDGWAAISGMYHAHDAKTSAL